MQSSSLKGFKKQIKNIMKNSLDITLCSSDGVNASQSLQMSSDL